MFNLHDFLSHTDLGIMGLNVLDLNDFDKNFYVDPIHYKKKFFWPVEGQRIRDRVHMIPF